MNYLQQLKNQQVFLLGLGVTGISCAHFLNEHGVDFVANDSRETIKGLEEVSALTQCKSLILGSWDKASLAQADVIIVSPGIDLNAESLLDCLNDKQQVIGDVELFCRISSTPIIAVTGSNGKSTVVSMLTHVAKSLGFKAEMAGNIGVPILSYFGQQLDYLILELSSFQLETISSMRAKAACVLNVSDDHLDRHKTMQVYSDLKHKIYDMSDKAIVNTDRNANTNNVCDAQITFGSESPTVDFEYRVIEGVGHLLHNGNMLVKSSDLPLAGKHNAMNCLAVLALGFSCGWSIEDMVNAIKTFEGLPHRCQIVSNKNGIVWVNDSKATNIGATIAAIEGLKSATSQLILVAGGDGKGADFSQLTPVLEADVDKLLAFGKDAVELVSLTSKGELVASLDEAVEKAQLLANPGDTVMLSPACASIDMYPNYIARGEHFTRLVQQGDKACN